MARGGYRDKLPNKISFFETEGKNYCGPYLTKPTAVFKNTQGKFIEFFLDKDGNYIRKG